MATKMTAAKRKKLAALKAARAAKKSKKSVKPAAHKTKKAGSNVYHVRVYADGARTLVGEIKENEDGMVTILHRDPLTKKKVVSKVPQEKILLVGPEVVVVGGRSVVAEYFVTKILRKKGIIYVKTLEDETVKIASTDVEITCQLGGKAEVEDEGDDDEASDDGDDGEASDEEDDGEASDEDDDDETPKKKKKKAADEDEGGDEDWDL